jgi:hypothetical protein
MANKGEQSTGGRGGIRTHGTLAGTPVFKTGALNHSATLPSLEHQSLSATKIKNSLAARPNLDPSALMSQPTATAPDLARAVFRCFRLA